MRRPQHESGGEHFSSTLWADFARNLANDGDRHKMQAHLDAGCEECRAIVDRFAAVAKMALNERTLVVPEDIVDRAKQIARTAPAPPGWIENLSAITARLVESSSLALQPAGVRSSVEAAASIGDRMLFRAADYAVYLKVETLLGGETAEIVGEIVNEREHEENLEGIPVQMVARGRTLSETATNRFGEFLIEYPIRKSALLRFALKERGQRIDLPLGRGLVV